MWLSFFASYAFALILLIAPGSFLLRACSFSLPGALACAAPVSVAVYTIVGQVLWALRLSVSGWYLFVVSLVLAASIAFIARKQGILQPSSLSASANKASHVITIGIGLVIALLIVFYSTVLPLDGPESFSQHSDNMAHLGSIISMTETGFFSTLNASNYLSTPANQIPVEVSSSFYPSGWHIVCAIVASTLSVSAPLAENAVNFAFAGNVFPLGMCALASLLFTKRDDFFLCFCATALSVCFVAFPSGMYLFGPLYPNAASYCSLPALLCVFIIAINRIILKRFKPISVSIAFVTASIGVAVLQPNGIFAAIVMLTPYLVWKIRFVLASQEKTRRYSEGALCFAIRAIIVTAVLVVWYCLYSLPSFQGVVSFNWPSFMSVKDALVNGVDLGLRFGAPQVLLSVFVWVGVIWTLVNRKYIWVSAGFIIFLFMYVVGMSTEGILKTFLTGFWYNDQWRTSASLVFPGAILAAIGLGALVKALLSILRSDSSHSDLRARIGLSLLAVIAVIFPSFSVNGQSIDTAFGQSRITLEQLNLLSESNSYSDADDRFVQNVLETISEDDLVINVPADGSIDAYVKYGFNCYFKSFGDGTMTMDCKQIVGCLYQYPSNPAVKRAVENTDAKYVLLLDRNGFVRNGDTLWSTDGSMNESDWQGISKIEEGDGFELMLSDGTRNLYRIVR